MLSYIRAFAKSPFAVGILGVLILSFLVFGIGDVFRSGSIKDSVVQAGSRSISSPTFKQRFDSFKKQVETQQNNGQPITTEQAAAAGLDKNLVDQLAYSESFAEMFRRIGLIPSDKLVVSELRKNSAFFDPVTGKFDKATYESRLQGAGMTVPEFEGVLRDETAQTHFVSGLAAGLVVPRTYLASLGAYAREGRDFTWFNLNPGLAGPPPKPTDAELTAYVKANAPIFTKPELRQFTMIRFSPSMIAATLKVDEAAVKKRFEFEKDTLSLAETRSFVQVPVRDAAAGAQAVARLKAGEDPNAVAKALGVQTVAYTDAPKTAISDRKIADAAFGAPVAGVIGPVQGSVGLQVIKILKINPGHQATLEEARAKIEAQVKKDAATEKVYEQVQKYEDARTGGASLAEASAKVGLTPVQVPIPVTAQGADLAGRSLGAPPKLMQSVFSLPQGGESDVLDLGEGEYAAIHVDKILPAGLATLDEVRTAATQRFIVEGMTNKLKAKAAELEGRIKKGESVEQVAASVGAKVESAKAVRREQAGKEYSADLLNKVFTGKAGDVIIGEGTQLGFIVAKLDRIVTPPVSELAPLIEQQRDNFRNALFDDLGFAVRNAARAEIKPTVDYNKARTAIGLEALPATPAAGATKAKK